MKPSCTAASYLSVSAIIYLSPTYLLSIIYLFIYQSVCLSVYPTSICQRVIFTASSILMRNEVQQRYFLLQFFPRLTS